MDIVIVNWNSGAYLDECLKSIAAQKTDRNFIRSITVIDNASTDGSAQITAAPDLNLNTIINAKNLGFGQACNQGMATGNAPYVLFLNPDTRANAGFLQIPITYLEAQTNKSVALVGIQMIDDNVQVSRTCAHIPTVTRMFLRSLGLNKYSYKMQNWDHMQSRQVDHVIGAFYLIRREVLEELGGFDEDFFVYLEDLDLSSRLKQAGHKCMYLAEASIYHAQGGSSRNIMAQRLYYALHARLVYCGKHYSIPGQLLVYLGTLVLEPLIRLTKAVLTGSKNELSNTLGAYRLLYRRLMRSNS